MLKDLAYDRRVGDQRDQPTPRATGRASEDVDLEDPAQQLRPGVARRVGGGSGRGGGREPRRAAEEVGASPAKVGARRPERFYWP